MTLDKIQHIIQFIEANFDRLIAVEELETIGCYSYRNLQRVFKTLFKESLGEFQKRLKLENGYKRLIYTQEPITQIAYLVGFESLQSFTKSFGQQFGLSPTDARKKKKNVFDSFIEASANQSDKIGQEIVYLPSVSIVYKGIKTNDYRNEDIDALWDEVDEVFGQTEKLSYYGIIVDQPLITTKQHCRYEAAINSNKAPKAFANKQIFGAKYAKYIHYGNYDTIENTYRKIYNDWLREGTIEFDNSPIIEHYRQHHFNTALESNFITEILIPLKK